MAKKVIAIVLVIMTLVSTLTITASAASYAPGKGVKINSNITMLWRHAPHNIDARLNGTCLWANSVGSLIRQLNVSKNIF